MLWSNLTTGRQFKISYQRPSRIRAGDRGTWPGGLLPSLSNSTCCIPAQPSLRECAHGPETLGTAGEGSVRTRPLGPTAVGGAAPSRPGSVGARLLRGSASPDHLRAPSSERSLNRNDLQGILAALLHWRLGGYSF